MKNATTRDFLEEIEHGEAYVRYGRKDYFINGCQCEVDENEEILSCIMNIQNLTDGGVIWAIERKTPGEAMDAFLSEPLIDGKSFWQLEPDLEWTDGPENVSEKGPSSRKTSS
ncbi:MAG: hypothetical protein J6Y27_02235 [Bacteroidales bacterium]|nr:hypothetical protein [Bacteroidales bacterium]